MLTEHRWWNTVRYHRPSQLMWRGIAVVRRRLFLYLPRANDTGANGSSLVRRQNPGFDQIVRRHCQLRATSRPRGAGPLDGEFEFLNERRRLTLPIDWTLESVEPVSHLWRFHLHYHEFLLDGIDDASDRTKSRLSHSVWAIIEDWIRTNPLSRKGSLSDAWHPFCLSKRIAIWLLLWQADEPPPELRSRFVASFESQIRYMERRLEWDLRGNHLLENLRTLAMTGAFFKGADADRRLNRAARLLPGQFAEQILPSGEHFERSPMYHAQMLSAVLDIRDAVAVCRPELAARCEAVAGRMAEFLRMIVHPDGQVASFGDTAFGETPHVKTLLDAVDGSAVAPASDGETDCHHAASISDSEPLDVLDAATKGGESLNTATAVQAVTRATVAPASLPQSNRAGVVVRGGYWKWQSGGDCLLFDAAPVGADELPAHAHCDLLTIEASLGGKRLFVDSGVYDYGDGEMRRYCRSTAAHNVLQIDDFEQCDTWSRFRMGYRGHPAGFEAGDGEGFSWCRATHNAYRRVGVPTVGRWLACREGGPWFCVDWAEGAGRHQLAGRLHLSPDAAVIPLSPSAVQIDLGGRRVEVHALAGSEISLSEGWYCPDFGARSESTVLLYSITGNCPALVGWMMREADRPGNAELEIRPDGHVELRWRHGENVTSLLPTRLQ